MSRYFALGSDGIMYDLCDCGDIEAAEESAQDLMPLNVASIWLADEITAMEWVESIIVGVVTGARHIRELEEDGTI